MIKEHDCTKIGEYSCGDCVKNLRYALRDSNDEYEKLKMALKDEMRQKHAAFDQRDASDRLNIELKANLDGANKQVRYLLDSCDSAERLLGEAKGLLQRFLDAGPEEEYQVILCRLSEDVEKFLTPDLKR